MNILHIVPALEAGGVETGTIDLALSLKKLNNNVFVTSRGGRLVKELSAGSVEHIALPVHRKNPLSLFLIPEIASLIKSKKIDIVHASSRAPAWLAFFACRLTKTPFVTSCHGFYSNHFLSRVMGWGDLVMVISDAIEKRMEEAFNVPKEKIRLIYRGVNLSKYPYNPGKACEEKKHFTIINIGRLTPIKGQREFIKAISDIKVKMDNVEALIVGGPDKGKESYRDELEKLVKEEGLEENVRFLGIRGDIPDLLKKTDCLVLSTNIPEGFGRACIEAGAIGTAVCASDTGGIKEIIDDGITGLLFPPGDKKKMQEAILKILENKELRKLCTENLRKKVEEKFSLKEMTEKTLSVYEEAIKKKRKTKG